MFDHCVTSLVTNVCNQLQKESLDRKVLYTIDFDNICAVLLYIIVSYIT